ncbi:MAG: DUF3078 domain-containing protein [Bacteroidetes bacterium]|nr:MAG: DUF3078 domain-containing protein [Bacteroidota bacterium]
MKTPKIFAVVMIVSIPMINPVSGKAQETAAADAASDTLWKTGGIISLNLSQLALTNWAAGGENSISGNGLVQLSGDYNDGILTWDNDLVLGYGMIKQGGDPARKTDDRIELSSKLGYKAAGNWSYSGLVSFRTQFAEGYDDPGAENRVKISDRMAPGYLNLSAGMDYRPSESFSLLIAPLAGKITFVLDDELSSLGSFDVDPGEQVRAEFGGFIKAGYQEEIMQNITLNTAVGLFSNYLENPQYVDVNWDLLLSLKVNDYISATLQTQLIYDRDILFGEDADGDGTPETFEPRVQFKELFGIGLNYTF